ncbi:Gfo/Idh/MocA family protein [Pontiella agarivorans]|uniref:Gfo/Idh/MocA family oxidoreductase n=1 Tax=Pontiella agarivorans TaxID=3038953 RepID=A0ABU5N0W1_9BACT|nr:Gfo/Idh/MocA family oxidoreductase [Pontiella agarivorans]MDZ8120049.1 Gfo/Idh/MocA family oxidoreductase [Pontiella agarivorans]
MMRIGIIGMGFMGGVHLNAWQQNRYADVVAVCDANPIAGKTKGNIDAGSDELNLDGIHIYTEIGAMLSAEKLDAVSITLPTHLHKSISIQCLEAGVHVLCEKPMALNVEDCNAMMAAADEAGKELMVAHCIRFWPAYAWIKSVMEQGCAGEVKSAEFSRLTYAPVWSGDSWFSDQSKSGGIALDLHIHDLDFIQHLFGEPDAQHSDGLRLENGAVGHVVTELKYGAGKMVRATASWLMPESYGFRMAYEIIFEKLTAVFDGHELKIFPVDGEAYTVELDPGDGYTEEINYFSDLIRGAQIKTEITTEQARESVRMALETMKL